MTWPHRAPCCVLLLSVLLLQALGLGSGHGHGHDKVVVTDSAGLARALRDAEEGGSWQETTVAIRGVGPTATARPFLSVFCRRVANPERPVCLQETCGIGLWCWPTLLHHQSGVGGSALAALSQGTSGVKPAARIATGRQSSPHLLEVACTPCGARAGQHHPLRRRRCWSPGAS